MTRQPFSVRRPRSWAGATIAGLLLVAITASPTLAVSWGTEVLLTASAPDQAEILRTGPNSAIALYVAAAGIYARRTADGGLHWTSAVRLATGLENRFGASSYGPRVDIAFVKRVSSGGTVYRRVFYLRSFDGGATWGVGARMMTSSVSQIADVDVARSPVGQVSIIWTGLYTGSLYMRTSTDGGKIFGVAVYSGKTLNSEIGPRYVYRSDPQVAIGDRVTYLVYTSGRQSTSVRHTLDRGAHWSAPVRISTTDGTPYSIVAASAWAVVGYTETTSRGLRAFYRRTGNRGTTWSSSPLMPIYPAAGYNTFEPQFTTEAGVLAVLVRYGRIGVAADIWHRQSSDRGSTWSALTPVNVNHDGESAGQPAPGGLAILDGGRQLAGYFQNLPDAPVGYWVRPGS
jgi:hypothetical protein